MLSRPSFFTDSFTTGSDGVDVAWARSRGLQVSHSPGVNHQDAADHAMVAYVQNGMSGWLWDSGGQPLFGTAPLTNPVWIAVNMLLRGRGLRAGGGATHQQAEAFFDLDAAVAAAAARSSRDGRADRPAGLCATAYGLSPKRPWHAAKEALPRRPRRENSPHGGEEVSRDRDQLGMRDDC